MSNNSDKTGSTVLSIRLNNEDSSQSNCSQEEVSNFQCSIFEESDNLLMQSETWPCSDAGVTIDGIAVGTNRKIVCTGLDAVTNISHLATITGVEINSGQSTQIGILDAYPFITLPAAPSDGQNVAANNFSLTWSSVPSAVYYHIEVAQDQSFQGVVEKSDITQTNYPPRNLLPETTYYWRVSPIDFYGNQGKESDSWQFTTMPGTACRAPSLNPIGSQSVDLGATLTFNVTATDADTGDILTYTSSELPDGAQFNPNTGRFSWATGQTDQGNYMVQFTVCDTCADGALCDSEEVNISVGDVCRPPILNPIGSRQVMPQSNLNFTVNATDEDQGAQLTYLAENLPTGATFNAASRTFSWTPAANTDGNYDVYFEVCDECSLCDAETITITVGDACQPPVLATIGSREIEIGEELSFTINATDADLDSELAYSADFLPEGAVFDNETRTFSWVPDADQVGTHTIQFIVEDNCASGSLSDEEEIVVNVIESENSTDTQASTDTDTQNSTDTQTEDDTDSQGDTDTDSDGDTDTVSCQPPVLEYIGPQQGTDMGSAITIQLNATDPDEDSTLTFYAYNLPDPNAFDSDSGYFYWEPEGEGTFTVTFEVCDDCPTGELCDSQDVVFQVDPAQQASNLFSPTTSSTTVYNDLNAICRSNFGNNYRLSDWRDIENAYGGGTAPNDILPSGSAFISNRGSQFWRNNWRYIVSRNSHHVNPNFDNIHHNLFSLSASPMNQRVLCILDP